MTDIHFHLACIALITGRFAKANEHVIQAWNAPTDVQLYVLARLRCLRLITRLLCERATIDDDFSKSILSDLKTLFHNNTTFMEWKAEPILKRLEMEISSDDIKFLTDLVAAMGNPTNLRVLDQYAIWREAELPPHGNELSKEALRESAQRSFEKGNWEAAKAMYEKLLTNGESFLEITPKIVTCLLNAHENIPKQSAARIGEICSRLEREGHSALAGDLRRQLAVKEASSAPKPFWKSFFVKHNTIQTEKTSQTDACNSGNSGGIRLTIRKSIPTVISFLLISIGVVLTLSLSWGWVLGVPILLFGVLQMVSSVLVLVGVLAIVECPKCQSRATLWKKRFLNCPKCQYCEDLANRKTP